MYLIKATFIEAGVDHLFYVPASSEMTQDTKGHTKLKAAKPGGCQTANEQAERHK